MGENLHFEQHIAAWHTCHPRHPAWVVCAKLLVLSPSLSHLQSHCLHSETWHITYRVPTLYAQQNSQPFPYLFQAQITVFPTKVIPTFTILVQCSYQFYHWQIFLDRDCSQIYNFLTIFTFSPALKEIPNLRGKFPNFSRPGKPKMKFPNFSQIPNPVYNSHHSLIPIYSWLCDS